MVLATLIGFVAVLTVGFTAMSALTAQKARAQHRAIHSVQSMYLAEAAVERAKVDLSADFSAVSAESEGSVFSMGEGQFYFDIAPTADPDELLVTGYGAVPDFASPQQVRSVQIKIASVPTTIPIDFDYAIFASDTIDINGSANTVAGDIFAGNNIDCSPASCPGVTGSKTEEGDSDYPFPELNMDQMKAIAISQGNYFASTPTADELPADFYFTAPSGGHPGVPNIVYIEGTLTVGSGKTVGGLVIVAGDYATNPSSPGGNMTMNGNARVKGVIYALGNVTTNGGGTTSPTIDGVIYSQSIVTLNGKPVVANSSEYVNSLETSEFDTGEIRGSDWNEVEVPDEIRHPD